MSLTLKKEYTTFFGSSDFSPFEKGGEGDFEMMHYKNIHAA